MTFFYDLNKRLQQVLETPKSEHKQLNEGAHTQDAMKLNPDFKKVGQKPGIMGKIAKGAKKVADFVAPGDEDLLRDLERKSGARQAFQKQMGGSAADLTKGLSVKKKSAVKEGTFEGIDYILSKYPREVEVFKQGGELDYDLESDLWDYYFNRGDIRNYDADASEYIAQRLADELGIGESAAPMTAKQKSFAKLAPPADKITFADKIAGAKKEVDEMLGDAAAEAIKGAIGKKQVRGMGEATKEIPGGRRHTSEPGGYGRKSDDDAPKVVTKKGRGRPKKGSDSETGEVMRPDWSAFGVGGKVKLPKHTGTVTKHKMVGEDESADVEAAIRMLKKAGYTVSKGDEEPVTEKAVSKKQQKFMGMVHAAQKGEKPASKEVAKVAREMPKKEAEKFAKTKHKGLPEKKKKTDETTVAGNVATAESSDEPKAKSKGGINFGGSIYDSVNREVENLIAESMNINMSMNTDQHGGPAKSLTVTATDEDADKLAALLQMAGIGGQSAEATYADSACQVDENQPENTPDPVAGDGEMYAGGLNKPKRDVAGDGQATGTVTAVHATEEDDDELRRMMEMAGIRESKKPDFLDLDNDGNKKESMSKAAEEQKDKVKEEKIDESIFASTADLWKTYKG